MQSVGFQPETFGLTAPPENETDPIPCLITGVSSHLVDSVGRIQGLRKLVRSTLTGPFRVGRTSSKACSRGADSCWVQTTSWHDLLRKFDAALVFVRGLGLGDRLAASRFQTYRDHIAELISVDDRDGAAASFAVFTQDTDLNGTALMEAHELATVVPYLQAMDPARAVNKLKRGLRS